MLEALPLDSLMYVSMCVNVHAFVEMSMIQHSYLLNNLYHKSVMLFSPSTFYILYEGLICIIHLLANFSP